MKTVVLDGHTLNPGDLDWGPLKELGKCAIFPRSSGDEILNRAQAARAVLTNKTPLDADTLNALPELEYIGVLATGVNIVDLEAARERGIVVTNVPGYGSHSVAQMTFALLLEMTQQVGHHAHLARAGDWSSGPDFSLCDRPLMELAGKTLGIVGYGNIGRQVAVIGSAFGMDLLIHTAHPENHETSKQLSFTDIDSLFSAADVISLNCPLTPETSQLVNMARLARIKQGALLINTSRGDLIVEAAVIDALEQGYLGGYAADVLDQEPPPSDHPLLAAPNCIITPHIAWATREARQRLLDCVVSNLAAYLAGTPVNRVD